MIDKSVFTSFIILSMASTIKAGYIGMKLFIIALCGLAGMYMMHLLAQDYNKYQCLSRPGRSVDLIFQKTTPSPTIPPEFKWSNSGNAAATKILAEIELADNQYERNQLITLDRILQFDPIGCARRYVCTIGTKPIKKRTQSENNIIQMLRSLPNRRRSDSGQEAFNYALNLGKDKKDPAACAEEYPKCLFTISQMMKLVGIS